jgi:Flp pilus assembly protein TadD
MLAMSCLANCGEYGSDKDTNIHTLSTKEESVIRIARVNESAGDLAAAERQYKQAAAMSDKSVGARLELADFYSRQGASQAALDTLKEAHNVKPRNTEITRALANNYISEGAPAKALELLDTAVAANSKDALIYSSRGVALDMMGRYTEAQSSYQNALLLNPDEAVTFKTNLSMSYILAGDYNKAITLLTPLLNTPEATPNIRQNLALAYNLSGQSDKARKLGLKDISTKEAEDNVKAYRMMAQSQGNAKAERIHSALPPKPNGNMLPEDGDLDEQVAAAPIIIAKPVERPKTPKKVTAAPVPNVTEENEDMDEPDAEALAPEQSSPTVKTVSVKPVVTPAVAAPLTTLPASTRQTDSIETAPAVPHMALPMPMLKPDREN